MQKKYLTQDFYFNISDDKIALHPKANRDECLLMHINKKNKQIDHLIFKHLETILQKGDILVLNNTQVQKSRFFVTNKKGKEFEVLIVEQKNDIYLCKIKHSRKLKIGQFLYLSPQFWIIIQYKDPTGLIHITFNHTDALIYLEQVGEIPLPPYILRQREYEPTDEKNYQTMFANIPGSRAAPTAGLHFTPELLEKLEKKGVMIAYIQLFVSLGTFHPIHEEYIENHPMHQEIYHIPIETADILNQAYIQNKKVIAVGTTVLRTLESAFNIDKKTIMSGYNSTSLFIKPGYKVNSIHTLITNFHTPGSTLFVLICSLLGIEYAHQVYKIAMDNNYQFFSYGDAMMIENIQEI